jgi:hypothetical protein
MNDASPAPQLSGEELVSGLLRLLDVDDLGGDRFLGSRKPGGVGRSSADRSLDRHSRQPNAPCRRIARSIRFTPISCAAATRTTRSISASSAISMAAASPTVASSPASWASRS